MTGGAIIYGPDGRIISGSGDTADYINNIGGDTNGGGSSDTPIYADTSNIDSSATVIEVITPSDGGAPYIGPHTSTDAPEWKKQEALQKAIDNANGLETSNTPEAIRDRLKTAYQKRQEVFEDQKKAEAEKRQQEVNAQLDVFGYRTAYGSDVKTDNGIIYARSLRTGEYERIGRDIDYFDTLGNKEPLDYTVIDSPSRVRIFNEESGIAEPGVKGENGGWVPENVGGKKGPVQVITTSTTYAPFKINAPVTDNAGRLSEKPAWVLSYDTRLIYEPGGKQYDLAIGPTGKKLNEWGYYDPSRDAFIVTTAGDYSSDVDTLGELMLGRGSPLDAERDLGYLYGENRMKEFAGYAITPVEQHTLATVTTPATPSKQGFSVTYDLEDISKYTMGNIKYGMDLPRAYSEGAFNPLNKGEPGYALERGNPIDVGNDPLGAFGFIVQRNAPLREFIAPETYEPIMTHKFSDPYYRSDAGQAELQNFSTFMAFGLVGGAPAGLGRGVSITKDIIPRIPVFREAYASASEAAAPLVRGASAGLNKIGMPRQVRPVYDVSVYGSGVAGRMEPAITPKLDLSKTTSIPREYTSIVESELAKTEHSVFGGGAAGAQYKYTTPRVSRDIDAFVNNPDLVERAIKTKMGKGGAGVDVTDLHAFPEGYPVKGARYTVTAEYDKPAEGGLMLGSRLLGDPIPKVPRSMDIVQGRGLSYERLNYLAVRKYNALFEDIAGIENPLTNQREVSRLSNRLGKDALDVKLHMTELLYVDEAKGGNLAVRGRILGDLEKIYNRPIRISIGGVERRTTVGELAMEEASKQIRLPKNLRTPDDLVNINLEMPRSTYPGILKSKAGSILKSGGGISVASLLGYGGKSTSKTGSTSSTIKSLGKMMGSLTPAPSSIPYKLPSMIRQPRLTSLYGSVSKTMDYKSIVKSPYGRGGSKTPYVFPSRPPRGIGGFPETPFPPDGEKKSKKDKRKNILSREDWTWGGLMDVPMDFGLSSNSKKGRRGRKSR